MNFRKYFIAQESYDYDKLSLNDRRYRATILARQLGNREFNRDIKEREYNTYNYVRNVVRASYKALGI